MLLRLLLLLRLQLTLLPRRRCGGRAAWCDWRLFGRFFFEGVEVEVERKRKLASKHPSEFAFLSLFLSFSVFLLHPNSLGEGIWLPIPLRSAVSAAAATASSP